MNKLLLLTLPLALLLGCKKDAPDPVDQLPPATQTGANTFGCLVNGQAWTPQGNDGSSNYTVSYDPSYRDGTLSVAAYRISEKGKQHQTVGVNSDSLRTNGPFELKTLGRHGAAFIDQGTRCYYYSQDASTYCRGTLAITRLDLQAGIVSGTFAFTLYKPGCDSVRVTQGRFDKKL